MKERMSWTRASRPRPDNVADSRRDAANQTTIILWQICGVSVKSKVRMENGEWRIMRGTARRAAPRFLSIALRAVYSASSRTEAL